MNERSNGDDYRARMRRSWLGVAVSAVLLASCSGGDDESVESATTPPEATAPATTAAPPTTAPRTTAPPTTQPPTTAPATTAAPPATTEPPPPTTTEPIVDESEFPRTDAGWARTAMLTLDDFPDDWTEAAFDPTSDDDNEATLQFVADCAGVDAALIGEDVLGDTKAETGEFASPDGASTMSHAVGYAPDEDTASMAIAAIGDDEFADCYEQAITNAFTEAQASSDPSESLPPGLTLTEVSVDRIDVGEFAEDDEVVSYAARVKLALGTDTLEQWVNLIFYRDGRVLGKAQMFGNGDTFPFDVGNPLLDLARWRAGNLPQTPNEVALLTLADLGEDWEVMDRFPDEAELEATMWQSIAECLGVDPAVVTDAVLGETRMATDQFFHNELASRVMHVAGLAADEPTAQATMAALGDERLPGCYADAVTARFDAANAGDPDPFSTLDDIQVTRRDTTDRAAADEIVWYTIDMRTEQGDEPSEQYDDLIILRDGEALSFIRSSALYAPVLDDVLDEIVPRAQERLAELERITSA